MIEALSPLDVERLAVMPTLLAYTLGGALMAALAVENATRDLVGRLAARADTGDLDGWHAIGAELALTEAAAVLATGRPVAAATWLRASTAMAPIFSPTTRRAETNTSPKTSSTTSSSTATSATTS